MCGTKSRPRAVIKAPGSASIKNGEEGAGGADEGSVIGRCTFAQLQTNCIWESS
jgi:hypothetical protein